MNYDHCENASSQSGIIGQSNTAEDDECYLLQMPNEILETIFTGIRIQDLLSLRDTSERLCNFVDHSTKLWASCTLDNKLHFDQLVSPHIRKAAACGNFSAIIRTALFFNELSFYPNYCPTHAEVLDQLHKADMQSASGVPFSWFFFRQQYVPELNRHPAYELFQLLKELAEANQDCHGFDCYNIASLLYYHTNMNDEALKWLKEAAAKGVSQAAYKLWSMEHEGKKESTKDIEDSVSLLQKIQLADPRNKKVQLQLCKYYSRGHYGTLDRKAAIAYVRKFFSSSYSYDSENLARHNSYMAKRDRKRIVSEATCTITNINLDDVMLHRLMKLFNKYMCAQYIPEIFLPKLIGTMLMVLLKSNWMHIQPTTMTSVSIFSEICTYDLPDNNKNFANVFEVTKGNFEMLTVIDYLDVILAMQDECEEVQLLSYYISNLSLMSDRMSPFPEAEIAVASYVLARGMHLKSRYDDQSSGFVGIKSDIFPNKVAEFTGISFDTAMLGLTVLNWECKLIPKSRTWNCSAKDMVTERFKRSHSPVEFPGLYELLKFFNININECRQ